MKTKIKEKKSFRGEPIYIGIDVHKNSWSITILTDYLEHKTYSQSPDSSLLISYLQRNFPGGTYLSCYEAGFSGFWLHHELKSHGVQNIVINAADVPSTNKDNDTKTDHVDSRKLARALRGRMLTGIYVPGRDHQERRSLSRYRLILMRDLRRSKNRIKSLLQYYGINIPERFETSTWSKAFVIWLKTIKMQELAGEYCLQTLINNYEFNYKQMLEVGNKLRSIFRTEEKQMYNLLRSVPGVGPITAIALISELGPTDRFKKTNQLASFVGLTPRVSNSGEKERTSGITYRSNKYLRTLIIEASWIAIRRDPALMKYYSELRSRMIGQKAIVKVARKLLNRIRYVMKNKVEYTFGIGITEPVK